MKEFFFLVLPLLLVNSLNAQDYNLDAAGSILKFKIKNFGFTVDGSFKGLKGSIEFDPARTSEAKFDVSVDAATVFTDNSMRDDHLREEAYFDVKNHPLISFVSTRVIANGKGGSFMLFGKLNLKGKEKEISFPFTATPVEGGFRFKGEFKINRRDFDVGGYSTLSDEVTIELNVVGKK